jgi:hypothetical protein
MSRASLPKERLHSLVIAAARNPCFCASPEQRMHDGACISCWALAKHAALVRELAAHPYLGGDGARSAMANRFARTIAEIETEQRLRAEQLPSAERRLADARKEGT